MEEMLLKEMGQRLSARRKQLRLTQEEVAERADMTTQTISTAENGIKALRPENIIKLCGALKISADYLLFGTISSDDQSVLFSKVSQLSPAQYRHLEDIVNSFIAAFIVVRSFRLTALFSLLSYPCYILGPHPEKVKKGASRNCIKLSQTK